jgi:hypothetical protein
MLVESSDRMLRDNQVSRSAREIDVIKNRWCEEQNFSKMISDDQKKKENLALFIVTNNVRVTDDDQEDIIKIFFNWV